MSPLPDSPVGPLWGRCPSPEPFYITFICLSKSPLKEPHSSSPTGPLWTEMLITKSFLYIAFRIPSKGALSSRLSSQRALRKVSSISRALLQLLEFPLNGHP